MALRFRLAAFGALLALLLGLAVTRAQVQVEPRMIVPSRPPAPPAPVVIAGPDVGFQMTGMRSGKPVGQLVVRVNGEWVPVEFAGGVMSLAK